MKRKFPRLDPSAAQASRDEAIDAAEDAASISWRDEYLAALRKRAARPEPFLSEDVTAEVGIPEGIEPRAIGALIRSAKSAGLIKPTGLFREGRSVSRHAAPAREWIGRNQ